MTSTDKSNYCAAGQFLLEEPTIAIDGHDIWLPIKVRVTVDGWGEVEAMEMVEGGIDGPVSYYDIYETMPGERKPAFLWTQLVVELKTNQLYMDARMEAARSLRPERPGRLYG